MKILVEFKGQETINLDYCDGIILGLKDYSVMNVCEYSLEQIEIICNKYKEKEIFVNLNRNFFNDDIEKLKEVLKKLASLKLKGVFFYDMAVLELKKELNLDINLVWNQTFMVNNYETCNYYYKRGVEYALLGKEITLEEIKEIILKSDIKCMVEVISRPSVAFSKRKLISNYCSSLGKNPVKKLIIKEKVSLDDYIVLEEDFGTGFYKKNITNGTSVIKELNDIGCDYIIIRENIEIDGFLELVRDTFNYVRGNCKNQNYVNKYKSLGCDTNFFFNKTIYRVKKNG